MVVDVGGGIGSATMTIAKKYPELQYVVQDTHVVIGHAAEVTIDGIYILITNLTNWNFSIGITNSPDCMKMDR